MLSHEAVIFDMMSYLYPAVAVLVVLLLAVLIEVTRLRRAWNTREQQHDALLRTLQEDMRALCAGAAGIGDHLVNLEHRVQRIADHQETLELRDSGSDVSYGRAIRLARQGAALEELVENCGLSRGEAELLLRLHCVGSH